MRVRQIWIMKPEWSIGWKKINLEINIQMTLYMKSSLFDSILDYDLKYFLGCSLQWILLGVEREKNQEGLRSRPLHDIGILYESHLQKNRLSLTAPFLTLFKPFIMTKDVLLFATTQEQLRTHGTNTRGNQTFAPLFFHSLLRSGR